MMRDIRSCLSLAMYDFFGFRRYRAVKSPKERTRMRLMGIVIAVLLVMAAGYSTTIVCGLIYLGLSDRIPLYLCVVSSLLVCGLAFFRADSVLFSAAGYDLLASFPLHTFPVVLSRFVQLYVGDVLLCALITVPGMAVAIRSGISVSILFWCAVLILTPLIPLCAACCIGSVIAVAASHMRHTTIVRTILSVLFVVVVLIVPMFSGSLESISPEQITEILSQAMEKLSRMYPVANWANEAVIRGSVSSLILMAAVSISMVVILLYALATVYHPLMRRLHSAGSGRRYKGAGGRRIPMRLAIARREAQRYISSTVYVTNTIVGPLMMLVLSIGILVGGVERITGAIPFPMDIRPLIPYGIAGIGAMMLPAACSISIEGRQWHSLLALPISTEVLMDGKRLFTLLLVSPFYLVTEICLHVALCPTFFEAVVLWLYPASLILFVCCAALRINVALPNFTWEKEVEVVKQGAAGAIGGFLGIFSAIVSAIPALLFPNIRVLCGIAVSCILLVAAAILRYTDRRIRLECIG